jgi:hypothetical protein
MKETPPMGTESLVAQVEHLIEQIGKVEYYAKRCTIYGPADALRDHLAKASVFADGLQSDLNAALRPASDPEALANAAGHPYTRGSVTFDRAAQPPRASTDAVLSDSLVVVEARPQEEKNKDDSSRVETGATSPSTGSTAKSSTGDK